MKTMLAIVGGFVIFLAVLGTLMEAKVAKAEAEAESKVVNEVICLIGPTIIVHYLGK
jgi:hypothetical protein